MSLADLRVVFVLAVGLSLLVITAAAAADEPPATVSVTLSNQVTIVGLLGSAYQSFVGVPYAEPPVNDYRFANPVPKALSPGVYQATTEQYPCIQMNFLLPNPQVMGVEDCLYLNVYRPQKNYTKNTKLPVMVYIHGGAFFSGFISSGIHGPGYFMKTGEVILVMMQYRLSTLGFLSTGDKASPGNFGLKDQSLALKWVKDNIKNFGGDPSQVTIFGQSAGAASVGMHMLSPLSKNLFSQAIAMSGNALGPYNYPTESPLELARTHANILGIPNADQLTTDELVARLREIPAAELISSVTHLKYFDVDSLTVYRTVVEPAGLKGAFLTDNPWNLMRKGRFADVPFMVGLVETEGAVRAAAISVNEALVTELNANISTLIPLLMELRLEGAERVAFTQKIIDRYLPGTGMLTPENQDSFIKMYSDRSFVHPHQKLLEVLMPQMHKPIYTYYFDYRGEHSYSALFTGTLENFGVVHCDDLIYLFESPMLFPNGLNQNDTIISDNLVKHYVKFAKGLVPWQRTSKKGGSFGPYLSLASSELHVYDVQDITDFWDQTMEFNIETKTPVIMWAPPGNN